MFNIHSTYAEVRERTPGKLETPHERGPNETSPNKMKRPVWPSSRINGPPLSPWQVSRSAVPCAHNWLSSMMIGVREFALNCAYESAHDCVSTMGNCKYCGNEFAPKIDKIGCIEMHLQWNHMLLRNKPDFVKLHPTTVPVLCCKFLSTDS